MSKSPTPAKTKSPAGQYQESGSKVTLTDLHDQDKNTKSTPHQPDKYYSKYNKLSQMASTNLDDFRELSTKADKQLQELEKMLNKHQGESGETDGSAKYVER